MSRVKLVLFIVLWLLIGVLLLRVSFIFQASSDAIVAEVESQRKAISYHKPVRVKNIFVFPGQQVEKGDKLLEVERPDMLLDIEKRMNELESAMAEKRGLEANYQNRLRLLALETDQKITSINSELTRLESGQRLRDNLYRNFSEVTGVDSITDQPDSLYLIDKKLLEQQLEDTRKHFQFESKRLKDQSEEQQTIVNKRIQLLNQEIEMLKTEEKEQVQFASVDGTVGNVYVEIDELAPAFKTIISVYESNPTLIRAFMNEIQKYPVEVGQVVTVESTNRQYQIEGQVVEIGARIIEYPTRLRTDPTEPVWGQEVFVSIPADNKFINGEKVFVMLN